jgi:uncharacterized protein YbaP (TraB family)
MRLRFRTLSFVVGAALAVGSIGDVRASPDPPVCVGTDFRDRGDQGRRELADAEAKAIDVRNGEGTFWRIEPAGGGTPSHLLGTLHVTDPAVTTLDPRRRSAFAAARVLAVENRAMLDTRIGGAERARNLDRMLFTDGRLVTELLEEGDRTALRRALADRGIPLWLVVGFKPWMITFGLLQFVPCEAARMKAGLRPFDFQLLAEANAAGKKTADLEEVDVQARRLDGIPLDVQVRLLRADLAMEHEAVDRLVTAIRLYREGRVATIVRLMFGVPADLMITEAELKEVTDRLLDQRNADMFDHARPLVDEGGAFLAVGAGHLIGERGLVARFQDAGYTVTRID